MRRTGFGRGRLLLFVALLVAVPAGAAEKGDAGGGLADADAFRGRVERALGGLGGKEDASPALAPTPAPTGGPGPVGEIGAGSGRLAFAGLVPGRSTKVDVDLLLGDPVASRDGRVVYEAPAEAPEADRIEVIYTGDRRLLHLVEVVLKQPLPYGELAARAGRRALVEKDATGRVWEYRIPTLLALGYPAPKDGPPLTVDRLRYTNAQYLADLFIARGQRAEGEGRPEDALIEFEKATRIDATYAAPYMQMGRLWQARGEPRKALVHYTAATRAAYPASVKAGAHLAVGRLHHEDKQGDLALRALERAVAENPGDAAAHFWTGLTYQSLLRKPAEALAAYQRAVALKPDLAAAHHNTGLIHLEQKDLRAAAAAFQKAVEARPEWVKPSDQLLPLRLTLGDFAGAEQEARRRLALRDADIEAMAYLAMALSSQLPERAALIALLTPLSEEHPRLKEALEWLGRAVARGYADTVTLEQSPYLRQLREQAPRAFRSVVAGIAASPRRP
jgi:tetratricopeptide (TPR) repeat protein